MCGQSCNSGGVGGVHSGALASALHSKCSSRTPEVEEAGSVGSDAPAGSQEEGEGGAVFDSTPFPSERSPQIRKAR